MHGTGATQPDPEAAAAALRSSQAAQSAARIPRARPGWLPALHALLCAGGFTFLGLSMTDSAPQPLFICLAFAGLSGFLIVTWLGLRHGGVAPWFAPRAERSPARSWGLPALPIAAGLVALIPYGTPGGLVAFGVTAGLLSWVSDALRQRAS